MNWIVDEHVGTAVRNRRRQEADVERTGMCLQRVSDSSTHMLIALKSGS